MQLPELPAEEPVAELAVEAVAAAEADFAVAAAVEDSVRLCSTPNNPRTSCTCSCSTSEPQYLHLQRPS